jgi:hypothetical protein
LVYYVIILSRSTLDQSNLPILKITTKNGATIPDEPKILGTLQLINNGNGRVNTPNDTPTGYDGYLGIELRGSTSKDFFPKNLMALNFGQIQLEKVRR